MSDEQSADDSSSPKPTSGKFGALLPLVAGIVGGGLVSAALCQFVFIPKVRKIAASSVAVVSTGDGANAPDEHAVERKRDDGGHGSKPKDDEKNTPKATYTKEGWAYPFPSITANLSGSLGRQYLKCSFQVVSDDKSIGSLIEENKAKLKDVVLSVLSARSLADVESPSAKSVLRTELVANLNKALNSPVVKQVQFTDFLIQ